MKISSGESILFQGDSITDAGRSREQEEMLGGGYAMMAAAWLHARYPEMGLKFQNRGVSGNRVKDLRRRWQEDCLDLHPDWVSVMIGINDTWRRFDSNDPTTTDAFHEDYRFILQQSADAGAKLILIEPFVLPFPENRRNWRQDLDPRIHAVRDLAAEFNAILVPLDGIMSSKAVLREPGFFSGDGVHPKPAGHAVIAQAWLSAVGCQ